MLGLKNTDALSLKEVMTRVKAINPLQDFVWDGEDIDDQPASLEELQAAIAGSKVSDTTQVALNIDNKTLEAFKSKGSDWQERINLALKDWLKTHSPA